MSWGVIAPPYPTAERPVTAIISGSSSGSGAGAQYLPGFQGIFGSGAFAVIYANQSFTVPAGVSNVRARAIGVGGSTANTASAGSSGGAGGGYAQGVFPVTPGQIIACTVPAPSTNGGDGGTVSFGTYAVATGGQGAASGVLTQRNGGVGTVTGAVDGTAKTGKGGAGGTGAGGGGGASGSQMGDGGAGRSGTTNGGAGGAVGGVTALGRGGPSLFGSGSDSTQNFPNSGGPDVTGVQAWNVNGTAIDGNSNAINASIRFPFDGFTGGGGFAGGNSGPGAGGAANGGAPGFGGGGGGASQGGTSLGAPGQIGGGAGGQQNNALSALGGRGLIVIEW